jgi:hypothetical protein
MEGDSPIGERGGIRIGRDSPIVKLHLDLIDRDFTIVK